MITVNFPPEITRFLRIIETYPVEKTVLDCGAGGRRPPLALFSVRGYKTTGIDIDESRIVIADEFAKSNNLNLNIIEADMREIPFDTESFGCVFSYNTVFHMNKVDMEKAIGEMLRVLKIDGLLYVNFIWQDGDTSIYGEERNPGEFWMSIEGEEILHSCHHEEEAEKYFENQEVLYKEAKKFSLKYPGTVINNGYINYVVKKKV
ncbi:MAG: class I SAM-dependent methyltransferase [Candidatus Heimdallarchaeaceae archaeon]